MHTEIPAGKKKHRWFHDSEPDEQDERYTASKQLVEVKRLRRVVKRGEMAVKHGSEIFERDKVTQKDLEVTKEVVERLSAPPAPPPPEKARAPANPSFKCFECNGPVPLGSEHCPRCGILYVKDPKGEALDEGSCPGDTPPIPAEFVGIAKEGSMVFMHLDPETGVVTCLLTDEEDSDFGLECHNCGAVTQLGLERCPLCGHNFGEDDTGLISLLEGLKFDLDDDKELDCPSCGEHVVVEGGRCPACKEIISFRFPKSLDAAVRPVLKEKNIVFVHLDVPSADLWFARKYKLQVVREPQAIHLDTVTKDSFDHDWKGLARI